MAGRAQNECMTRPRLSKNVSMHDGFYERICLYDFFLGNKDSIFTIEKSKSGFSKNVDINTFKMATLNPGSLKRGSRDSGKTFLCIRIILLTVHCNSSLITASVPLHLPFTLTFILPLF